MNANTAAGNVATSVARRTRKLIAPAVALAAAIGLALALAPVTFGPLFFVHTEVNGVPKAIPQIVGNSGALTGAVIFFLVIPAAIWLFARLSDVGTINADAGN